jgi:hypothetical protein
LLRVDGSEKFPVLSIGSDERLEELMEVVAFGFPFGTGIAGGEGSPPVTPGPAERREYPSVSVNAGSITALRRKLGRIDRIQLDATINPGNSGGPVLDKEGKVIGVVVSMSVAQRIGRTGISSAIPAGQVTRFLARPDVSFTLPEVKRANQDQPAEFKARTTFLLPTTTPVDMELLLARSGEPERRFPMKLEEGIYRAQAIPFPGRRGPLVFPLRVQFDDGAVTGRAEDRAIRLDGQGLKLSQVEVLRFGAKTKVKLVSGSVLEGTLAELDSISVNVGKQVLRLDLANALEIKVDAASVGEPLSCTVIVHQHGKEIARVEEPLYPEGAVQASMDALRDGRFIKPPRSTSPVSYFRVISSKGEPVGRGASYSYPGEVLTVHPSERGVNIAVGNPIVWQLNFGAPIGLFLEAGEYQDAKRYVANEGSPGIDLMSFGRFCNNPSGKFMVWEFEVKAGR